MQIINDYNKRPDTAKGSVIALGNFDGVHKGHVELINTAVKIAKDNNRPSAVMTFEPHPINVFKPEIANYRLTSKEQKASLLEDLGIDYLYAVNFTKEFASITAKEFIEVILLEKLCSTHIVTGDDFIFGHNKGGDADMLEKYSKTHGFGYSKIEAVGDSDRFSSTRARKALKSGDLNEVSSILDRNYTLSGIIVKGENRGKSIGFPTINIDMGEYLRPKQGVYAVRATIQGDGRTFRGVANLGVKPTFNGSEEILEVHIFDFDSDVYGKTVQIEFLSYIREERKFKDAEELVVQIKKDCIAAKG